MKTNRLLVLVTLFSFTFSLAFGQNTVKSPGMELPNYIATANWPEVISEDLSVRQVAEKFQVDPRYTFELINSTTDKYGFNHKRYRQICNGVPVENSMWILHYKNGKLVSANGDVYQIKSGSAQPAISEAQAFSTAKDAVPAQKYLWDLSEAERGELYSKYAQRPLGQLVWMQKDMHSADKTIVLAFKYDIYAAEPSVRKIVYVDANTGQVVNIIEGMHDVSTNGTATTLYSGTKPIKTDSLGSTSIRLFDLTRGNGIRTKNMNNLTSGSGNDIFNTTNTWTYPTDIARSVLDAHWGGEIAYDYFWNNFGRNSYNGAGAQINILTHYGYQVNNAFWDGTSLKLGDANINNGYRPFSCLGIVGHELTHAVTEYTADLIYSYQSGALNESFSDIFGETMERLAKPGSSWAVGEESTVNNLGLRSMSNPNSFNDPDTYLGNYWYTGSGDNGGVHTNSSVQNYWYYLLVNGGAGTNDNNDAYNITGIGLSDAADIAYRNLSVYLTPSSQYADARFYAIQSAKDIFGDCSNEVIQTTNAWYAVGVGSQYNNQNSSSFTAAPNYFCSLPATVQFTNTSPGVVSCVWDFGDGQTSTQINPIHVYNTVGTYDVKLITTHCNNAVDSVLVTNAITVDPNAIFCDTILSTTGTSTYNLCTGVITDNAGPYNNYSNNISSNKIIANLQNAPYRIKFLSFNTENNYDFVRIYDGPSTTSPLIGSYDGSNLPNNGNYIYTTNDTFLIRFTSDQLITDSGFVATFECLPPVIIPVAGFSANDTVTCNGTVIFTNTSTNVNAGTSYAWDFGDGNSSTAFAPTHTYNTPGFYTVQLIACNGANCDTTTKVNFINYDPLSPNCGFYLQPTSGTQTVTGVCNGILYDDGHLSDYSAGINNSKFEIVANANSEVRFVFDEFNLENDDTMRIWDVTGAGNILLAQLTGSNVPNESHPFWSSQGILQIEFYSNNNNQGAGFKSHWSCSPRFDTTNFANFYVDTLDDCLGVYGFNIQNIKSNNVNNSDIDAGDGMLYTSTTNVVHNYISNGTYLVRAIYTEGDNTFYDYATVNVDPLIASATIPDTVWNGTFFSMNNTTSNALAQDWYVDGIYLGNVNPINHSLISAGLHQVLMVTSNNACTDTLDHDIWVNEKLGIQNVNQTDITLYPNPVNGTLYIVGEGLKTSDKWELKLVNMLGQTIWSETQVEGASSGKIVIQLPEIADGYYQLILTGNAGQWRHKLQVLTR